MVILFVSIVLWLSSFTTCLGGCFLTETKFERYSNHILTFLIKTRIVTYYLCIMRPASASASFDLRKFKNAGKLISAHDLWCRGKFYVGERPRHSATSNVLVSASWKL